MGALIRVAIVSERYLTSANRLGHLDGSAGLVILLPLAFPVEVS
jgi:hypothetical protein